MNTQLDRNKNGARWARCRRAAGVILSTLLLVPGAAMSAAPPTGLKVMLQPWDPKTDDDSVKTVVDSPDLLSSELSKAWTQSKPDIIEALKKALGKGDMIADGVTLYDININLNEPSLRIEPGAGDALKATFTLPDSSFEASATQPTIAGKWADPRCSVRFTLDVTFAIRVTDTPSRLL